MITKEVHVMTASNHLSNNVIRFNGFADLYDQHRPEAPVQVVQLLTQYVGHKPTLVLDIGCGTGLSTFVWNGYADEIIGIEPNDDMRAIALAHLDVVEGNPPITFIKGYSDQTSVASLSADIVTCSQSFHWMEPQSTLQEVNRVLKPGGVFAAYDCDWPPTLHWSLEADYMNLLEKADIVLEQHVDASERANKWNKNEHLQQIQKSGLFRYTREIVFHNIESCNSERYVHLAISQGSVQSVLKHELPDLEQDIENFKALADDYFNGRTLDVMFNYRMRIGVK
jgi:ubiquinone/menaquinone biosynthesis C-methylase UbiE